MQIHQAISARVDGEDPGLDESTIYGHLAGCADCRVFSHRAESLHRSVRLAPAPEIPDLTPRILSAIGAESLEADSLGDGEPDTSLALRWILVAIAVAQIAVAIPALVLGSDAGLPVHAARHIGSFDVALAVGFLYAAWKPSRIPGLLPVVAALVVCLVGSSLLDVADGSTKALGEVQHVFDFVGLAVVWLLSRPTARRVQLAVITSTRIRRFAALAALVVALVVVFAAPASAHASLLSTDPSNAGVYDTPPKAITLRFSEGVEVSLGDIRVYTSDRARVVTGKPEHPNGQQSVVTTSLPKIGDGTYVVTWRVISADSHPVEGAYTFQVGSKATLSGKNAKTAAASLLATTGGSRTVGVVYGIDRGFLYAGIALLIGGAVFLAAVWPTGRDDRRARWLVWSGWITVFVTTGFGIALEGVYGAGLPLSDVFDTTVLRDELDTRYGHIALIRLALLVLAIPLLRVLLHRRPTAEHPLRSWWMLSALVVGAGIAVTPGIAGHASTGIQTGLAIPADLVHMSGMACWLGGLVLLSFAVLPRRNVEELRRVLPRYSALALGAIVALVVSGGYQAWRQVGSFDELKTTDYGRLLIAKLVAFVALIVAAVFSREIVNRRFRTYPSDDEEFVTVDDPVLVGAGGPATTPTTTGGSDAGGNTGGRPASGVGYGGPEDNQMVDEYDDWDDDLEDQEEMTRLRRSVWAEVAIAVVILSITAMLVNAAPARAQSSGPVSLTLKSSQVWVYADIAPGVAGPNDMHFTALPTGGGPATVTDMTVQLTRPGEDLPPFTVPLQKLGAGHYYAPLYDIPYSGKWQMTVRVQLGQTNEAVLTSPFSVRGRAGTALMPDVDVATNFFLVLTFVADAVVAFAIGCAVAALVSPRARASVASWARAVAPQSVVFAWIVATVSTLGSLYYSEHAGFVPCELCWYQRIVMYPLVIVLGVAALRRDRAVWMTALVFVVIGTPLSLYHWLVERVPAFEESSSCSATTPCSAPWFEKLGFVTLAWMAMSAFLLIGVLMVCTLVGARDRVDDASAVLETA